MDELVLHLSEQIGFLLKSARDFDNGDLPEAKRMATAIRTLVHQTDRSHAVLEQCGVLGTMQCADSSIPRVAGNLIPGHMGLVALRLSSEGAGYGPSFAPPRQWVPFNSWWRTTVMWDVSNGEFSRYLLVTQVANTDGGAHVGGPKPKYVRLSRQDSLGWTAQNNGGPWYSPGNPALSAVRQITLELLVSIERQFPGLVP